ncbi:MAG: 5-methyltetrahydrofolate--homocysteine methyltransferase [Spirochaetes bacterium]|nr:MAG: 5-methyltetrahydrofolate--homocysteine methyltransferase [Spirochaetota bacterium]
MPSRSSVERFLGRLSDSPPLILDGATGTIIMKALPGFRGCIESLNLERADLVRDIHRAYLDAGADIIETNTFGGSALKLEEYGLASSCREINERAAAIAREAVSGSGALVAGSIGPSGRLVEPLGETRVSALYDSFALQAEGLARGGADIFIIETMNDILEAKTALRAARDTAPLPVICSMTFEPGGKTLTGTDIFTGLATLAECGAHAVGINCSMGPDGILALYRDSIGELKRIGVPLTVWANAGLPEFTGGLAHYHLSPEEFADTSMEFARMGIAVIGGCCGTTPGHIAALKKRCTACGEPSRPGRVSYHFITSRYQTLDLSTHGGPLYIGERLNPTARKKFAEELKSGRNIFLREESRKQEAEGAYLLDINVGVPGLDEVASMRNSISILSGLVRTPLMIDSDNPLVLAAALDLYPGVGIINSVNGKERSLEGVLPLLRRCGSFVVALCLDETGVHREAGARIAIGERLIERLAESGIEPGRVFIDPLMLAESAEPGAAMETLAVIEHFYRKGIRTSLGISNISFGLPARKHINAVFLTMAREKGLTAAIVNPSAVRIIREFSVEERLAHEFLTGRDPGATAYIRNFKDSGSDTAPAVSKPSEGPLARVERLIIEGNGDEIESAVRDALATEPPDGIMNGALIKGLGTVGDLYNSGEYFLPQMIASANAMKKGFALLKPLLTTEGSPRAGKVVICTVRGDVHDIGKNIVAMMLENHGFEVYDLGKDIPAEDVLKAVEKHGPHLLCLSSLLTTTLGEMGKIAGMIESRGLRVKMLIGGAVATPEYAASIGAHYAADAVAGVKIAKGLVAG